MYTIKCDDHVLYDLRHDELYVASPKLDLEVNRNGIASFKIYPQHPYYDQLYKLKSVITIYQDDKIIFKGRIIDDELGFHNEKQVSVEGILAYLLDSIHDPFEYQGNVEGLFADLIDKHNKQVEPFQQFKIGKVTVIDPNNYINRSSIDYLTTKEVMQSRLIDTLGGYLNIRYEDDGNYIDYLSDFENISAQTIEFGENLISLKQKTEAIDIKTAIIPLGAKLKDKDGNDTDKRLTIETVNYGKNYLVDDEMVSRYGKIFETVIYDDVTLVSNLLKKGQQELSAKVKLSSTIELTAIDLNNVDKNINSFHFCDYIRILSKPHNIDKQYLLKKMSIDLANPQNTKITLGETIKTLTDINVNNNKNSGSLITTVNKINSNYVTGSDVSAIISENQGLASNKSDNSIDPNTTIEELILTNHENVPLDFSEEFFFIRTMFDSIKSEETTRRQIAYPYTSKTGIYTRYYTQENNWSKWELISSNVNINTGGSIPTGRFVDGKMEFVKRINFGPLPNATTKKVSTGLMLSNITITDVKAMPRQSNGDVYVLPFVSVGDLKYQMSLYLRASDNTVVVDTGSVDRSNFTLKVDIYYIKNEGG